MRQGAGLNPIEHQSEDVKSFSPRDVKLSTVWYISEGRNAWHSTWSTVYYPKAFGLSPDRLKDKCEGLRTQGSVFTVQATPLAIFKSERLTIGIAPVNERAKGNYTKICKRIRSGNFFRELGAIDKNWLRAFQVSAEGVFRKGYQPMAFRSRSHGGAYRLGWTEIESRDYPEFLSFYREARKWTRKYFEKPQ